MSWSVEENNKSSGFLGRIDLKNDVTHHSQTVHDQDSGLWEFSVTTAGLVHRTSHESHSNEKGTFTKSSVKQVTESNVHTLTFQSEENANQWHACISKYLKKRSLSMSMSKRPEFDLRSPSPDSIPKRNSFHTSSRSSSPSVPIDVAPLSLDARSRMVKQHGYLELQTTVESAGEVISSTRQRYFIELVGGYITWYQSEEHVGLGLHVGRIQLKATEAEMGEITENDESKYSFAVATHEDIKRREVQIADSSATILKSSLKKEQTTFVLSSTNKEDLGLWHKNIALMVKRRALSSVQK